MKYFRELRQKYDLHKEFEKTLALQLDSLIFNKSFEFNYIVESGYDKIKIKEENIKLTKNLKVF